MNAISHTTKQVPRVNKVESKPLRTTGDMRSFLLDMMLDVRNNQVTGDMARSVVKLAGQVTESLYAELKHKKLMLDLKQPSQSIGGLTLDMEQTSTVTGAEKKLENSSSSNTPGN